jgi:mannosyltransferase
MPVAFGRRDSEREGNAAPAALFGSQRIWLWFAIVPLAAFLRFLCLSRKSVYLDEALSIFYAHLSWHEFAQVLSMRDANMALYYLLLRGMMPIGDSEFWVRLPSVVAGVGAVPVIYALGSKLFDRRSGLLAALLLSVNACHVVYSQEARGYALAVLLVALSSWLFVKGIEAPSWKSWFSYALISALAVHSHFYAGLVLLAQWTSLFALPRRMVPVKHFVGAMILSGVLISPALLFVLRHHEGHINWVPAMSWLEVYHTAIFLAADGGKVPGNLLLLFCLLALLIAARELLSGAFRRQSLAQPLDQSMLRWKQMFPWFWLLVPMVVTAAGSLWTPLFFHRFLIVCLPAFILLVARGLTLLRPYSVWAMAFAALSILTAFLSYSRTREDWRGAAHYVLSQEQPGDAIWFCRGYADTPFLYYGSRFPVASRPDLLAGADIPDLRGKTRLWVVFYPIPTSDSAAMESKMTAQYSVLQQSSFRGMRIVLFNVNRLP